MKSKILFILLIFFISVLSAQTYNGTVIDFESNKPLEGVTVYFDGTTIGVVTNQDGYFNLKLEQSINATLVISYIGYETQILDKTALTSDSIIKMKEKEISLKEVVLSDDDWSRKKKLGYFRRGFLGKTTQSKSCKILNEDVIRLRFSKVDNTLYAEADEPIIIKNDFLGYFVEYNLIDFEVNFKITSSKFNSIEKVIFSGTSIYKEFNYNKTKKRFLKNRNLTYSTSLLFFMRSLVDTTLKKNDFRLFVKDPSGKTKLFFETLQDRVFKVEKYNKNLHQITLLKDQKIVVRLKNLEQASLNSNTENHTFYVDHLGLYYPIKNVLFGGAFGYNRIATMLPSNYQINASNID